MIAIPISIKHGMEYSRPVLSNMVATSPLWLLRSWNVTSLNWCVRVNLNTCWILDSTQKNPYHKMISLIIVYWLHIEYFNTLGYMNYFTKIHFICFLTFLAWLLILILKYTCSLHLWLTLDFFWRVLTRQ